MDNREGEGLVLSRPMSVDEKAEKYARQGLPIVPFLVHPLVGRQVAPTQVPELSLFYSLLSVPHTAIAQPLFTAFVRLILFVTG